MMARRGDWIQTYSGRQFWPLDPRPEEVDIVDIAAALSKKCRYGGHCLKFYSVAEHCVLMARFAVSDGASMRDVLWALLHDAGEAYLPDVLRPVKRHLVGFAEVEDGVMRAVAQRYGMAWPQPEYVKLLDNRILTTEMRTIMVPPPQPWSHPERDNPLPMVTIMCWPPRDAQREFLRMFEIATAR